MYEWVVREDGRGWHHWKDRVPAWSYPAAADKPRFTQLLIPTLDSVRYEHLLSLVYSVNKVRACIDANLLSDSTTLCHLFFLQH